MDHRFDLVVVGTGVAAVGHVTLEALELMRRAERLLYVAADPMTRFWLSQLNPSSESLEAFYGDRRPRQQTYRAMADRMVGLVRDGFRVCAAFYGHPAVFVDPTHRAIARLRRAGYDARMLPGVSADGCLYADLGINPGDRGVQLTERLPGHRAVGAELLRRIVEVRQIDIEEVGPILLGRDDRRVANPGGRFDVRQRSPEMLQGEMT